MMCARVWDRVCDKVYDTGDTGTHVRWYHLSTALESGACIGMDIAKKSSW